MELILADPDGKEIRNLIEASIDLDLGETNDFRITVDREDWKGDIVDGCRVFRPGTEYGGLIRRGGTNTKEGIVTPGGYTWRGMLNRKIIEPPSGENYKTVSGELHAVMKNLIEPEFPGLFFVPEVSTGVYVNNFQLDRYCTLLIGIQKMLKSVGYRINIVYIQQERGDPGYVQVSAVQIQDYSDQVELSSDTRLNFTACAQHDGVNHLVCLGKGELSERIVMHLYVQADGTIGTTQYYTGVDEISEIYENAGAEAEDLEKGGRERLQSLMNQDTFSMDIASLGIEVEIGDIIGGRDYLTGIYVQKPVAGKIWKYDNGYESLEYKIEGEI